MGGHRSISVGLDLSEVDAIVGDGTLSAASQAALDTAVWVAKRDGARLHLLTALDLDAAAQTWLGREAAAGRRTVQGHAEERLAAIARDVRAAGVAEVTVEVSMDGPAESLVRDAARSGRDLVVTGTRERGEAARNLLGSTALGLVRRSPVPVWIARAAFGAASAPVACAIDLGDMAPRIVAAAAGLAAAVSGPLHVIHVLDSRGDRIVRTASADPDLPEMLVRSRRERAEREIPSIVDANAAGLRAEVHFAEGPVNPGIAACADRIAPGLLVVGSIVHSALGAAFGLGRTAEYLLGHARTSILVLKP